MSQSACLNLAKAKEISERVLQVLSPHCDRIEIAGSIRRGRPLVHDIDLVVIPRNQGSLLYALQSLGRVTGGEKLIKVALPETTLDVYIATESTWVTLLLIRTGSARHNIRLCQRARELGYQLHADGRGLTFDGELCEYKDEQGLFSILRIPYRTPAERE